MLLPLCMRVVGRIRVSAFSLPHCRQTTTNNTTTTNTHTQTAQQKPHGCTRMVCNSPRNVRWLGGLVRRVCVFRDVFLRCRLAHVRAGAFYGTHMSTKMVNVCAFVSTSKCTRALHSIVELFRQPWWWWFAVFNYFSLRVQTFRASPQREGGW